jgi:hypothetical protein
MEECDIEWSDMADEAWASYALRVPTAARAGTTDTGGWGICHFSTDDDAYQVDFAPAESKS